MASDPRTIFQGVKFFWRTRNTVDITLVEHSSLNAIEIVTYDPMLDREAARLYVDNRAVIARLDHQDIDKQVHAAQLNSLDLNEEHFTHKAAFNFWTSHLLVTEFSLPERKMVMALNGIETLQIEKPQGLAPFQSPHFHTLL